MRNKLLLGTLLGICAFVFLGIAAPDTLDQKSARTYGSVGEAGDILLLVHYEIDYAVLPADPANETFLNMYNDVSVGYGIKAATPYVYVNSGYGEGAISIYLDATEAAGIRGATPIHRNYSAILLRFRRLRSIPRRSNGERKPGPELLSPRILPLFRPLWKVRRHGRAWTWWTVSY